MHKSVLFVIFLLTAAAAGLLWWQGSLSLGRAAAPPSMLQGSSVTPVPADADAQRGEVAQSAEDSVPEGLFRTEVVDEGEPAGGSNVHDLALQIWDRKDGVPAAAAEVFVLDDHQRRRLDWGLLKGTFVEHWSSAAERDGRRFVADADGRVDVLGVVGNAIVAAKLPGAYGCKWIGDKHGEIESVTLQADETVTVRVVDGDGRPVANAPVGVLQRMPAAKGAGDPVARVRELERAMADIERWMRDNPGQSELAMPKMRTFRREFAAARAGAGQGGRGDGKAVRAVSGLAFAGNRLVAAPAEVEVRARRLSDEQGLAVFRHFQLYRKDGGKDGKQAQAKLQFTKDGWPIASGGEGAADGPFEAVLLMPLQQPVGHEFPGNPIPDETIELRMPATGSITLRTVDLEGRPFVHPVHAELRMLGDDAAPWSRQQLRKEQNEAAITFPFVGIGLDFVAACRLDDDDFRWQSPEFAGPRVDGECVELDLVVAPDAGLLFGRLLDAAGVPLAGSKPTFLISCRGGRLEGEEVVLDEQGRFHLPYLAQPRQQPPFRFEVRRNDIEPIAGLALPLAELPVGRITDLGDLRIDAFGEIAHGMIVDDRGEPIAGANLQLQRERDVGDKQGRLRFVDEAFVTAKSDAEGRYAVFGTLESGRYQLRATAHDHFPADQLVVGDGRPLVLRMDRKCRIVGTVLAPEWLSRKRVRAQLECVSDQSQQPREEQLRDYQGKTYAYFDWVRPGTYNVSFRVQEFPDPFLRVDGVMLAPGQTDLHPRLTDLDLGAWLYRFEVHCVDQDGQVVDPQRPLLARITRPNGQSGFVGFPMKGGETEILSASPQLEVVPVAIGYQAERALLAPGRSELRFLAIPPVDVFAAGISQLANGVEVQIVLELLEATGLPTQLETWDGPSNRISGWYARSRYSVAMLGPDDVARVQLLQGGRHKVAVRFGVNQGVRPATVQLGEIDVRLQPGGQPPRCAVAVDLAAVQQAVAQVVQALQANEQANK